MPDMIDEVIEARKDFTDDNGTIFKALTSPKSWNDETRSARFVMSAEEVDHHRDIVVQAGIDTDTFETNPIALFGHNSWATPIGSWKDLSAVRGSRKRTEGTLQFTEEGLDEQADKVARHVAAGTLRACSIGFRGKDVDRILDDDGQWTYGYKFNEIELLECSVVTIPAVRQALVKGVGDDGDLLSPAVIEEFLENLKSHPAVAKMVDQKLYSEVLREITGNKTFGLVPEMPDYAKDIAEFADRLKALERVNDMVPVEEDPIFVEIEKDISTIIAAAEEKVADTDDDKKGLMKSISDGIRKIFLKEPEPEDRPAPLDQEKLKAAIERADGHLATE